ncbi:hypothetical protein VTL71DRAFT_9840 [Oculimacula yallundae]|uniref:Nephrocystin 3-like N-terminal domain-containing protein n=1 Tax=Oculimacula yallundae TaxID=86028 RepID=A0ABR4BQQ2_9HELO
MNPRISRLFGRAKRKSKAHPTNAGSSASSPPVPSGSSTRPSSEEVTEKKLIGIPATSIEANSAELNHAQQNSESGFITTQALSAPLQPNIATQRISKSSPNAQISNEAFKDAIKKITRQLSSSDRKAFEEGYELISPEKTFETIRELDRIDAVSNVRVGSKALEPAIEVLNTVMRSISISVQHSPEISSLVVGGIRLIIDLVAKFVQFYHRLSQMICQMVDYLKIFDQYSKISHDTLVHQALVDVYGDLITFCVETRRVFVDPQGALKKYAHFRTFCRVQWQPFEERFGEIKLSFAHHLDILVNSVQSLQLTILNEQFAAISLESTKSETERTRVLSNEQAAERRQFLKWISDIDYEESFNAIIAKKHPGTGKWLLYHDTLQTWLAGTDPSLLWCHGKPGAGKSVLSSLILDHVSTFELNDPETCVIFAYYSYQFPERHSLVKLLESFIRQLASKLDTLPSETLQFFRKYDRNARRPYVDDLLAQFSALLLRFPSRAIVIIDGLDECEPESRQDVFKFVARLVAKQSTPVKVFVTSRKEQDIQDALEGCPIIEVNSNLVNEDIQTFLRFEIDRRIEEKLLKLRNAALKEEILKALSSKASGMFLWAKLQLDWICQQGRDSDIRVALKSLPPDLYGTYDRILERIEDRPPALQELVRRALMWVFYAKRTLLPMEIAHALSIQEGMTQHEELEDSLYSAEIILSACGGFLLKVGDFIINANRILPIHYSVQEYFTSTTTRSQQDLRAKYFTPASQAHEEIANTCIDYFQLDTFSNGPCDGALDFLVRKDNAILGTYATFYFDKHLEHVEILSTTLQQKLKDLLNCDAKHLSAILQWRRQLGDDHGRASATDKDYSSASAATMIVSTTLHNRPEFQQLLSGWSESSLLKGALHHAVLANSEAGVAWLLKSGLVDVNEHENGWTPLMSASRQGFYDIARRLVDNGKAEVNTKRTGDYTALSAACVSRDSRIVRLLIENGAVIHPHDTTLACHLACKDPTILDILLTSGAPATSSLLSTAVENKHLDPCLLLLDHGADITLSCLVMSLVYNGRDHPITKLLKKHSTPEMFSIAEVDWASSAFCQDDSILESLLANGAVATSEALETSVRDGCLGSCDLLLEHGAHVTTQFLDQVFSNGMRDDVTKLLVKHSSPEVVAEADMLWACSRYCTDNSVLSVLLKEGAIATSQALEATVEHEQFDRCSLLLDYGSHVTAKALAMAWKYEVDDGHEIVELLSRSSKPEIIAEGMALLWEQHDICPWSYDIYYYGRLTYKPVPTCQRNLAGVLYRATIILRHFGYIKRSERRADPSIIKLESSRTTQLVLSFYSGLFLAHITSHYHGPPTLSILHNNSRGMARHKSAR